MPDIKTKNVVKGTVKTIDKSAVAAERMKDAYIRTKDKAEHGVYSAEGSAEEYAADRISGCADTVTREAVRQFDKQGRRGVQSTKNNISKAKEHFRQRQAQKSIKTLERGEKTIKQTAKSTGKSTIKTAKGSVKTAQKTVKTAEQTARTAIKTSEQAAKVAQKTAQALAKAARTAALAAKATAKATVATIKAAAKATVAAVKAIIAGTKALISAIAAGGWVAVVIIIVVCLIALIVGSCFGIFFSGEDSGSSMTMQSVVQEINTDYQTQLDTTKTNISYDVLEMSGSRAVWPEVLAVHAVKTTTDPNNPQEVASIDESKRQILKEVFWTMNEISFNTAPRTENVVTETDDGNGNIVETTESVTRTYLYIRLTHKTPDEMAQQYGFTDEQKEQLRELLSDKNKKMREDFLFIVGEIEQ